MTSQYRSLNTDQSFEHSSLMMGLSNDEGAEGVETSLSVFIVKGTQQLMEVIKGLKTVLQRIYSFQVVLNSTHGNW